MRVVVTGATGNVGTSVVEALLECEVVDTVVGLARRPPSAGPDAWPVEWVEADIVTADLAQLFEGADVVVHLAWAFQPTHGPAETWRTNVEGSQRVFDAALGAGVDALVHASSVGAYRAGLDREPVDESWPTDALPTAAYGREKSYLERVLDAIELRQPGTRIVRLRPAFIFSRRAAPEQRRIFAGTAVPRRLFRTELLPLLPLPAGLRFQALTSEDAADAYVRAVTRPVRGAYNVAATDVVDAAVLGDIAGTQTFELPPRLVRWGLAALWHARVVPASPELFDLFIDLPLLDPERAWQDLGWRARTSSADAVREFVHGVADSEGFPTAPLQPQP
jgi:UDP-glucose 4-epimerase